MTTTSETRRTCEVQGCAAKVHGRGLCRTHYDQDRYLATTGHNPEAEADAAGDSAINRELAFGSIPSWQSPHGTQSIFATDEEHRRAWQERRDELMAEYLTPPRLPGRRPEAWWRFEAGRPQYLTEDDYEGHDLAQATRQSHEREVEKLGWLAANGHLTETEIEIIERRAQEARERIGTDREQIAALSANFGGDKLRAAIGDVVRVRLSRPETV